MVVSDTAYIASTRIHRITRIASDTALIELAGTVPIAGRGPYRARVVVAGEVPIAGRGPYNVPVVDAAVEPSAGLSPYSAPIVEAGKGRSAGTRSLQCPYCRRRHRSQYTNSVRLPARTSERGAAARAAVPAPARRPAVLPASPCPCTREPCGVSSFPPLRGSGVSERSSERVAA